MGKPAITYSCNSCGAVHPRWSGKCDACGEWNCISEQAAPAAIPKGMNAGSGAKRKGRNIDVVPLKGAANETYPRLKTSITEFDRVLGGGIVPGSAILIGGDPGIGKSTLLLQTVCALAKNNTRCLYVSGEEAVDQVRMRAQRLGLSDAPVDLAAATNVRDIIATIEDNPKGEEPQIVIIDSIQTMFVDTVESAPGTVSQVRTSAQELVRVGKSKNISILFVGHVTKEGQIAGPRVLEHLVDTVLHFEGDRSHHFRILRGMKNRFGPTDEIGVFEMAGQGLVEVENPSALFLSQRHEDVAGSAVLAALEGTRPLLVEVQALIAQNSHPSPRRSVIGWDQNRLAMIVAVLETRCGLHFSGYDMFLNIAGGIRISEPAADMAVAASLISALSGQVLPADTLFFGEIGLAGELRQVSQADLRIKEAAKLGFKNVVIPKPKKPFSASLKKMITIHEVSHIRDLADEYSAK